MRRDTPSETGGKDARMGEDISKTVVWGEGGKLTKIRILRLSNMKQKAKNEAEFKRCVEKRRFGIVVEKNENAG